MSLSGAMRASREDTFRSAPLSLTISFYLLTGLGDGFFTTLLSLTSVKQPTGITRVFIVEVSGPSLINISKDISHICRGILHNAF